MRSMRSPTRIISGALTLTAVLYTLFNYLPVYETTYNLDSAGNSTLGVRVNPLKIQFSSLRSLC